MEDRKIIALYEQRDEQALVETERAYGSYCRRLAQSVLDCDADSEEVVSDVLMKLWTTIPPQKPDNLKLYIAKVTRNISLSKWRACTAKKRGGGRVFIAMEELGDCITGDGDVFSSIERKELSNAISDFLRRQKERDRAVFLRRYFFFEDTSDIAKSCGLKESNVLQILSRTRRKLKTYLIQEGYDL